MSYREISFISQQGKSSLRTRPGELRERHNDGGQRLVFTMDIKSLYTVIPNDEGLVSLEYFLDKREVKDPPTDTLVRMVELVLTLNTTPRRGKGVAD